MYPQLRTVMWNLDDSSRATEDYTPIIEIEIDAKGFPYAPKVVLDSFRARNIFLADYLEWQEKHPDEPPDDMTDQERQALLAKHGIDQTVPIKRVRWQIHPHAPLSYVAWLTSGLTGDESSEFWTSYGIFKVSAPAYGWRRLPPMGHRSFSLCYRVSPSGNISRNDTAWTHARDIKTAAHYILNDLDKQMSSGFLNVYFEFSPTNTWSAAEEVMATVLPHIDGLRGMWIGTNEKRRLIGVSENTDIVTLHFHDIRKNAWRDNRSLKDRRDNYKIDIDL